MKDLLLDHSVIIIALVTFVICSLMYTKKKSEKYALTPRELRSLLRARLNQVLENVAIRFLSATAISFVICMVSFRTIWLNDVFHTVFLTMLLVKPVVRGVMHVTGLKYRYIK